MWIIASCLNLKVRKIKLSQPVAAAHFAMLCILEKINLEPWYWHHMHKNNINHAILGTPRQHSHGISLQWAMLPWDAMATCQDDCCCLGGMDIWKKLINLCSCVCCHSVHQKVLSKKSTYGGCRDCW